MSTSGFAPARYRPLRPIGELKLRIAVRPGPRRILAIHGHLLVGCIDCAARNVRNTVPSSSGLGHRIFIPATPVRIRVGLLIFEFYHYSGVEQLVACEAHNLKVAGSSPAPATTFFQLLLRCGVERLVAREAHSLKVTGSNPVPATNLSPEDCPLTGAKPSHGRVRQQGRAVAGIR